MKRILSILVFILFFLIFLIACDDNSSHGRNLQSQYYTITFIQRGFPDIEKKVKEGKTLTEIPVPKGKTGYTVQWDRSDFSNITSNLNVYAIEIPYIYKIEYNLGDKPSEVTISLTEQQIAFGEQYQLQTPSRPGYIFVKWVISGTDTEFKDGIYSLPYDVQLTAIWEIDHDHDRWWTSFY